MAGDIISGIGGSVGSLFGSNEPPRAILNRYAAPTAKAAGKLTAAAIPEIGELSKQALDTYMQAQPTMQRLAGQQENVLQTLLGRQLNYDPNALLGQIGNTAFGFINPNVISPLSQFDINQDMLMRRARGLNPAAASSTAERLRNARIASGRYYDVARDVYGALPNLFGQAYGQQAAQQAAAAGQVPGIQATYEALASRPTQGLAQRLNTLGGIQGLAGQTIGNVGAATQGYQTPRNIADRIAAASQDIGSGVSGTLGQLSGAVSGLTSSL